MIKNIINQVLTDLYIQGINPKELNKHIVCEEINNYILAGMLRPKQYSDMINEIIKRHRLNELVVNH